MIPSHPSDFVAQVISSSGKIASILRRRDRIMIRRFAVVSGYAVAACLFPVFALGQAPAEPTATPPAPNDAAKSIRVAEGLEIQLFASEPLVRQPVSISFDQR